MFVCYRGEELEAHDNRTRNVLVRELQVRDQVISMPAVTRSDGKILVVKDPTQRYANAKCRYAAGLELSPLSDIHIQSETSARRDD